MGWRLAYNALKVARTKEAEDLVVNAYKKVLNIVSAHPGRKIVIAPVEYGGVFLGSVIYRALLMARKEGYILNDVDFRPVVKKPGRTFEISVPQEPHVFIVVDDVRGSGATFRQVLRKHPHPEWAYPVFLSVPGKTEEYRNAKMVATLSYVQYLMEGRLNSLEELLLKRKNPRGDIYSRWGKSGELMIDYFSLFTT